MKNDYDTAAYGLHTFNAFERIEVPNSILLKWPGKSFYYGTSFITKPYWSHILLYSGPTSSLVNPRVNFSSKKSAYMTLL